MPCCRKPRSKTKLHKNISWFGSNKQPEAPKHISLLFNTLAFPHVEKFNYIFYSFFVISSRDGSYVLSSSFLL